MSKSPNLGSVKATLRLAWTTLIVNISVIALGAVVRATESGAGCGRSWPTCQGTFVPAELSGATLIEFSHRATSGLAMVLTYALFIAVARLDGRRPFALLRALRGSVLARATGWAVITVTGSALIGAAIVLFEWVTDDSSIARTVTVPLHLMNTFALLAALAISITALQGPIRVRFGRSERRTAWLVLGSTMVVAGAGAVTALSDTLFPSESLEAGLAANFSATASWMTRVRVSHPILAVIAAVVIVRVVSSSSLPEALRRGRRARLVVWLVAAQMTAGVVNILLLTPVWMQVVHIVLADSLWVVLVWFVIEMASDQIKPASSPAVSTGAAHNISSHT